MTEIGYDLANRVTFTTAKGATRADDLVTERKYNTFGDLFQVIHPEGNIAEFTYDSAGRVRAIEPKPNAQATSHGERVVYTLDGYGNHTLEQHERWTGSDWEKRSQVEQIYSTRCYLDKVIRGFGGEEVTTEYGYDCEGRLDRVWDANHPSNHQSAQPTSEYVYDELDRLSEMHQPFGGTGRGTTTTIYGHDVQDNVAQVKDGEGTVTTYIFGDRDLATREISEVSGTTKYRYNEHGARVWKEDTRGIVLERTVDELDRVTHLEFPTDSLDVSYTYDDPAVDFSLGRLTQIERNGHVIEYTYQYDAAAHQTQVNAAGNVIDRVFDDAGRLTLQQRAAAEALSTFSYDGRGFLLTSKGRSPDSSPDNLFCDGFESGDISAWGTGTSSTCFSHEQTAPVYSSDGTLHARDDDLLLYFASVPVAQRIGSVWQHLTTDPLGTPIFVADLTGAESWQGGFEPFGNDFSNARGADVFLRLPGQWSDSSWAESSEGAALLNNVHRWYDPGLGLYHRVDPLGLEAGMHPYRYAFANPLSFVDVNGLEPGSRTADAGAKVARQMACAVRWGQEAGKRGKDGLGWPWAHCWASCKIARECGGKGVAQAVGLAKEGLDIGKCVPEVFSSDPLDPEGNCASAFQPSDFKDNARGFTCPQKTSCEQRCQEITDKEILPPPRPILSTR